MYMLTEQRVWYVLKLFMTYMKIDKDNLEHFYTEHNLFVIVN